MKITFQVITIQYLYDPQTHNGIRLHQSASGPIEPRSCPLLTSFNRVEAGGKDGM